MPKKTVRIGDVMYTDNEGKQYGISKRELGLMGAVGDKEASKALKRMKNRGFIYPDKILREKKFIGGLIKGKPKLTKKGWK